MSKVLSILVAALFFVVATARHEGRAAGEAKRGAQFFGACAPCHSLEADVNLTGPSLHGVWDRKAASLASFERYSPALKSSGVVWDGESLDAWLKDPTQFIPTIE